MREKAIETAIKTYLFKIGAYYIKIHGSNFQEPGIPDIIACYKGYFLGIEVKAPGKLSNQSEQQKIHQRNIEKSEGIYLLTDSLDDVVKLIGEIDEKYTDCEQRL